MTAALTVTLIGPGPDPDPWGGNGFTYADVVIENCVIRGGGVVASAGNWTVRGTLFDACGDGLVAVTIHDPYRLNRFSKIDNWNRHRITLL